MTLATIITREYAERYARTIGSRKNAIKAIKSAQLPRLFSFSSEQGKVYLSIDSRNAMTLRIK